MYFISMFTRLAILLFALSVTAHSQVIGGWNFFSLPGGSNNFGPSPFLPTTVGANVSVSGLIRGAGITVSGTGAGEAWGGNGFDNSASSAASITNNDFVSFTVTANAGHVVSLSSIASYNVRRSGTGPTAGQWQYRVGAGAFVNIGGAITWGGTTSAAGNTQPSINLAGITALQNVPGGTIITFRLLIFSASGTAGTWYLNDFTNNANNDFVINGNAFSTLPVILQKFTAECKANDYRIAWTTSSEINNDHFTLESSSDGLDYALLAILQGAGNSNAPVNYEYTDADARNEKYYRITQTDYDGTSETFPPVFARCNEKNDGAGISLTAAGNGSIKATLVSGYEESVTFRIFSMSGNLLFCNALSLTEGLNDFDVPVSLPSGMYMLTVTGRHPQYLKFFVP